MANTILGGCIRDARRRREWTLRATAKALQISPSYLSDIERGKRLPLTPLLRRCVVVLGMSDRLIASSLALDIREYCEKLRMTMMERLERSLRT